MPLTADIPLGGLSVLALLLVSAGSYAITWVALRYAHSRDLFDVPSHRSSHMAPTPRGGGVGIVLPVLLGVALAGMHEWITGPVMLGVLGGGVAVAAVGWVDDHGDVRPAIRAMFHLSAAAWVVFWLGGLDEVSLGSEKVGLGLMGSIVAVLAVTWSINLFNFMDGIDGFAAAQAIWVTAAGGSMLFLAGELGLSLMAFLTSAACIGFLFWNWSPASVFMGDVGSGFLGFLLGVLALAGERTGSVPVLVWLILMGVFFFDATLTLVRRVFRGERWHLPHRSHAYQRLVRGGWTHDRVVMAAMGVNLALTAFATASWLWPRRALGFVGAGLILLAVLYIGVERAEPMVSEGPA